MKDMMAGVDLHSNNMMLALVDLNGKRLFHKRLKCDLKEVDQALQPYRERINTIAVESTFNWYWLIDGLEELGYQRVLANPAAIQQYSGIKHTDDKHDAYWLAELLRLGILPTGYICERTLRPVRDLLRRRLSLVRKRTSLILSLRSLHVRMQGTGLSLGKVKTMEVDEVWRLFGHPADQLLSREELKLIRHFDESIQRLEEHVLKRARQMPEYQRLLSIPGVGKILGMTIALETGEVNRFPTAGDFASYARTVASERSSNERKKGENNRKCGNKYLAWAFVEAAHFAVRYDAGAKSFYERKKARTNTMVATKALACKLAKAAWHVMSKGVDFDGERVFGGSTKGEGGEGRAKGDAAGSGEVSLTLQTEVERGEQARKNRPAKSITSPVENSQLSDQAALGLRSRRALSSAGGEKIGQQGKSKKKK